MEENAKIEAQDTVAVDGRFQVLEAVCRELDRELFSYCRYINKKI